MGPRGHPAGSAAGLRSPRPSWGTDQQSLPAPATLALGPHRGRAAGMAPGPGMLPSVAGDRPGPWHPVYITMALWCNGDMLGWGGGPVLAPEPSPQSSEYEPGSLGQRSEGQGIQEGPQHPAPGCVPMPGVTGPNMPHFGEVCRFQGRAAYGGLGRTSCGVALGARAAWQSHLGQSHLADVPSPKPRGEDAAGKPQGAFIRERPCIAFHVTKPRGEPPT